MFKKSIKIVLSIITVIALTGSLTGCARSQATQQPAPSTGAKEVETFSQTFELNQIVDLGKMKLRILNVSLVKNTDPSPDAAKGKIALAVEIGNTSTEEVLFHPDEWQVVFDTGETSTPDLTLSSSLGGTYPPRQVQQGFITFSVNECEPDTLKELKLKIPTPTDKDGQTGTIEHDISLTKLKS